MMHPQIGRAAFIIASFVTIGATFTAFMTPRGSAEHTVSLLTIVVGLLLFAAVAGWARLNR